MIHTEFGGQSNQKTNEVPMALGSALYDIHQKIIKVVYLMTNLLDVQRYPVQALKALYHQRWQIEEGYKR